MANEIYFKPWKGTNYKVTKTLILSESAYSWHEDEKLVVPPPSHPSNSVRYWSKNFGKNRYFTSMSRALCATWHPTVEQITKTWNNYAYTIAVQGTVGIGARKRPSAQQFHAAGPLFLSLIEKMRPLKVIVTGKDLWHKHMPETVVEHSEDLQAYKLLDESLVWCLALPHPSNSKEGFKWEHIAEDIQHFQSATLPLYKS